MSLADSFTRINTQSWQRTKCSTCQRSYKYYCPTCNVALGVPNGVHVPKMKLPLQVHIFFQDKIKKSTAPHAKILAPNEVKIVPYPAMQDQSIPMYDRETDYVVYPTNQSETVYSLTPEDLGKMKTLIFIDCPWQKAPVLMNTPELSHLRCIKLAQPPIQSKFWRFVDRYHQAGEGCVSTIEAIQLMLEEYVDAMKKENQKLVDVASTDMSHLLFFFKLLYTTIAESYENDPNQHYPPPMDERAKARQRELRQQKEAGKKRKLENKLLTWKKIDEQFKNGEISERPKNGRCYNCKQPDHEAKECPNPCKYCKQSDHWSGACSMKKVRQALEANRPRTAA